MERQGQGHEHGEAGFPGAAVMISHHSASHPRPFLTRCQIVLRKPVPIHTAALRCPLGRVIFRQKSVHTMCDSRRAFCSPSGHSRTLRWCRGRTHGQRSRGAVRGRSFPLHRAAVSSSSLPARAPSPPLGGRHQSLLSVLSPALSPPPLLLP